jgi:hypothetical protein
MASKTTDETTTTTTENAAATGERDATATGAGRKTTCKVPTPDGPCVLWLNHEGPHDSGMLDETDLTDSIPDPEEIAALSIAERDALQVMFDEKIAVNFREFVKAGSDKPQWRKLEVRASMSELYQRRLRNGADYHNPPVGVRINASFVPGGKVRIMYAAVTRREYKRGQNN